MSWLGKSDNVIMEVEMLGEIEGDQEEKYKENRRNYKGRNLIKLNRFFREESGRPWGS